VDDLVFPPPLVTTTAVTGRKRKAEKEMTLITTKASPTIILEKRKGIVSNHRY
jgi:uncharacterized protein Veg